MAQPFAGEPESEGTTDQGMPGMVALEGIWSVSTTLTVYSYGEQTGMASIPRSALVSLAKNSNTYRANEVDNGIEKRISFTLHETDSSGMYTVEFKDQVSGFNLKGQAFLSESGNLEMSVFMSEEWHHRAAEIMGNRPDAGYSTRLDYNMERILPDIKHASEPALQKNPLYSTTNSKQ